MLRWLGKKMNALGDSLTRSDITGTGVDGIPWTSYMKELTGLEICRNYGIDGNMLSGKEGIAARFSSMDKDADILSIFGGANDFCFGVPLGSREGTELDTFYGALNTLARGMYRKYPNSEIFFITPPKLKSSLYGWESFIPNQEGFILKDYRDAILEVADYFSMPVLDFYSIAGMSCYLDNGSLRPDGLHFSNEGYKRLAYKIAAFINQL